MKITLCLVLLTSIPLIVPTTSALGLKFLPSSLFPTKGRPSNALGLKFLPNSSKCEYHNYSCSGPECQQTTETCPQVQGHVSHCYSMYRNTTAGLVPILKGCWRQNLDQCPLTADCLPQALERKLAFCCCTGDMCNESPQTK